MSYQLTSPLAVLTELAALVAGGVDLVDDRVEVEEDARLAGGRIDAVDHARPVDRTDVLAGTA